MPADKAYGSGTHIVAPSATHTHTIIFLHGRGSDAITFASEIFESQDSSNQFFPALFPSVKWVFPCAKERWAAAERELWHQWFDIPSVDKPWEGIDVQRAGLQESAAQIQDIIRVETELVGVDKVFVAGISQGCATAIFTLLTYNLRIGGFIGLCGWLPLPEDLEAIAKVPGKLDIVLQVPVLLQHCQDDGVVPAANGKHLAEWLGWAGMQVEYECFSTGGHWLNEPQGMDAIARFLERVMGNTKGAPIQG